MKESEHWEKVYSTKSVKQVGWYKPHLDISIQWIADLDLAAEDPVIDVGGGASTLVDDLLDAGHKNITVLDISRSAMSLTKERLGKLSSSVSWLQEDVTEYEFPSQYFGLWHDRAVFHFLIEPEKQQKYRDAVLKALKIGGYILIGTFDAEGPAQCSGLPVQRYTLALLKERFGAEFELKRHQHEMHHTPSGVEQSYIYCLFQRTA